MQWCAAFFTAGTGWDGWLLMCGAAVIFWALAVAGMVALFRASAEDGQSQTRPPRQPDMTPPPVSRGEASADRYEQSGSRQ